MCITFALNIIYIIINFFVLSPFVSVIQIQRAVEDLAENLVSLPAIENAEVFLNKLMEYNESDAPQHLMLVKQCTQSRKEIVASGPVRLRHFTLHYIPGFTHRQHIQLLFDILKTLPLPFQLLHCTANTTAEELELFFQRMGFFPEHKYIVLNTSLLSSDIQEVKLMQRLIMYIDTRLQIQPTGLTQVVCACYNFAYMYVWDDFTDTVEIFTFLK